MLGFYDKEGRAMTACHHIHLICRPINMDGVQSETARRYGLEPVCWHGMQME